MSVYLTKNVCLCPSTRIRRINKKRFSESGTYIASRRSYVEIINSTINKSTSSRKYICYSSKRGISLNSRSAICNNFLRLSCGIYSCSFSYSIKYNLITILKSILSLNCKDRLDNNKKSHNFFLIIRAIVIQVFH